MTPRSINPEREMDMRMFKFVAFLVLALGAWFALKIAFGLLASVLPLAIGIAIGVIVTHFCHKLKDIDVETAPTRRRTA